MCYSSASTVHRSMFMTGYGKGMTYTTTHRTVLTIFPVMMMTIITSVYSDTVYFTAGCKKKRGNVIGYSGCDPFISGSLVTVRIHCFINQVQCKSYQPSECGHAFHIVGKSHSVCCAYHSRGRHGRAGDS